MHSVKHTRENRRYMRIKQIVTEGEKNLLWQL